MRKTFPFQTAIRRSPKEVVTCFVNMSQLAYTRCNMFFALNGAFCGWPGPTHAATCCFCVVCVEQLCTFALCVSRSKYFCCTRLFQWQHQQNMRETLQRGGNGCGRTVHAGTNTTKLLLEVLQWTQTKSCKLQNVPMRIVMKQSQTKKCISQRSPHDASTTLPRCRLVPWACSALCKQGRSPGKRKSDGDTMFTEDHIQKWVTVCSGMWP